MISLLSQRLMTDTWNFIQLFFVGLHRGFQTISTQDQMKGGKNRSWGGGQGAIGPLLKTQIQLELEWVKNFRAFDTYFRAQGLANLSLAN